MLLFTTHRIIEMRRVNTILIIILLAVMIGYSGCKQSDTQSDDLITVDVTKTYSQKKELILQDFMDVEYVVLETNDEFINQGSVRAIGNNYILATNYNQVRDGNIFVYSRTGKALRKINHLGQGPEDYSNIMEIILDEDNDEIYIHNHYERKIQVYDLYGTFERSLKYKENTNGMFYTDIVNYDKNNLICFDKFNEERAFVLISKQDGKITNKINIPFKETKLLQQINTSSNIPADPGYYRSIITFKGDFILLEHSSDTVYTFLPDYSLRPFIVRTPVIQKMDPGVFLLLRLFSDRYYFMETVKNEFNFNTRNGFPRTFIMYDKLEKSFSEYTVYNGDFLTKKEIYMNVLMPVNHEIESWYPFEAFQLVDSYKKGELKDGRLKEIAAKLDEDDNRVIMLVKHKK